MSWFPLDAIVASLVLLVPGFIALKIIFAFPISKNDGEMRTTNFLLWSLAVSVVIQFAYYGIVTAIDKPKTIALFNASNISQIIFEKQYLLGVLVLLLLSAFTGLVAGYVLWLTVKKLRKRSGKAPLNKPVHVMDSIFDRGVSPYVIVAYNNYGYQGWLSRGPAKKDDKRISLKDVSWVPMKNGVVIDYDKKEDLDVEEITLDYTKANQIWVLNPETTVEE